MKIKLTAFVVAVLAALTACTTNTETNRKSGIDAENVKKTAARIVETMYGADTHNHVDVPLVADELPGPDVNLTESMKKNGMSFISMTFAVDYKKLTEKDEGWDRFKVGLDAMDAILRQNGMTRALTAQDIIDAKKKDMPIVVQSVEGSHFMDGNIDRLKYAYDRGLRHLTLLHDSDATVPLGDVFTNPPQWGGLTDFGKEVIAECERLGILVDLSHADDKTLLMALSTATKPVIVSHTGLNTLLGNDEKMAQIMKPRLISADLAKKVADKGGLIGVWTHLADSPAQYAKNIRAMVDVVGVDHVTIGTDTKLTAPYPSRGKQDTRAGIRTEYVWDGQSEGFFYSVVEAMLNEGFSESEIKKICGGNYLNLLQKTIH